MKKIAVVLTGCGYLDGSEIREAVGTLAAISAAGAALQCFALDENQFDVIDTLAQKPMNESRNMLIESARIARGDIIGLKKLNSDDFDAIIFPGGYGVAKNLCSFASKGSEADVHPVVKSIIDNFYLAKKPIGAICISPALIALSLKGEALELTLGETGDASKEIEKLGHRHIVCQASECHVDRAHKIVSTPAYMYDDGKIHEIFLGINKLVKNVIELT